ncbi:hypothetical protein I4U23_015092 [Adineta vaga]|nr:hypothetical protein I4U23_015092 [Adineta vaga]
MFSFFRYIVYSFFLLSNLYNSIKSFEIKCQYSNEGRDQEFNRIKRFVLFPEFILWKHDWRYLHHPNEFIYWISNYYPKQIDSNSVHQYIHHIIQNINEVIDEKIHSIREASVIDQANAHYNFFNYQICPTDDPIATVKDVQSRGTMLIYPVEVIKNKRYRAHGGIVLNYVDNSTTSYIKFNTHHTFLLHNDFQYDPVIYKCNSDESHCMIDLYAVLLHETLHGFGIEHTEHDLPNRRMRAVMHLYSSRVMCHDDIRAIRKVYGFAVKRENAQYDDTCRRDFPLNRLQKRVYKIHQWIVFYIIHIGKRYWKTNDHDSISASIQSDGTPQSYRKQYKGATNAFLWHEDYLIG